MSTCCERWEWAAVFDRAARGDADAIAMVEELELYSALELAEARLFAIAGQNP